MKKMKKILLGVSTSLILATTITTATVVPFVTNNQIAKKTNALKTRMTEEDWNKNKPFEFNNKVYLNLQEAYDDLIHQIGGIKAEQFIGEIINKNEDGSIILNNNPIREFDPSKVTNAYMDANGRYTSNYDEALQSFINASNLVTQYYDYKGNYFLDEEDAKYSMDNFKSMGLAYYKIKDYKGIEYKINPLNNQDIDKLKEIALEWIIKYPNNTNNPFKLKIVAKSFDNNQNEIYQKVNEIDNRIENEWDKFKNEIFLNNLYINLARILLETLKNNRFIKAKIYLKPYILDHNKDQKDVLINESFKNWNENKRFAYKFNNNTSLFQTKDINLDELYDIINTFFSREEFSKKYSIEKERLNLEAVNGPSCEGAYFKDKNNAKFASYFEGNTFNRVVKNMDNIRANSMYYNNDIITVKILEKSSIAEPHDGDVGPSYLNNYMITFGIEPIISKVNDFRNSIMNKIGNVRSFIAKTFWDSISKIKGNLNYKLLNIFFKKFNKDSLELSLGEDFNEANIIAYNDQLNSRDKNLFNKFLFLQDKKGELPKFSREVYDILVSKTSSRNDDGIYDKFNNSIDMHQWSYFTNHPLENSIKDNNNKNIWLDSTDDYLGLNAIVNSEKDSLKDDKKIKKFLHQKSYLKSFLI